MVELLFGLLIIIILAVVLLVYVEVIDLGDMVVGLFQLVWAAVRLLAGMLFALGAFFVWLATRRNREKKTVNEQRDC